MSCTGLSCREEKVRGMITCTFSTSLVLMAASAVAESDVGDSSLSRVQSEAAFALEELETRINSQVQWKLEKNEVCPFTHFRAMNRECGSGILVQNTSDSSSSGRNPLLQH